ncbi:MAG: hypothetical protein A2Y41_03735 [Spirochaetes bacterium GWB1_36_13]|nr:MAG: hypothetical protein A2Y41_03735 [Spirochaetes bacterium GWB1_36_13]
MKKINFFSLLFVFLITLPFYSYPSNDFLFSWKCIDPKGLVIFEFEAGSIFPFKEGFALFEYKGKYGYLDEKGIVKINPLFFDAYSFQEGRARYVRMKLEGKMGYYLWGYIDKNGKIVIEAQYDHAWDFQEERAVVEKEGSYGFIDPDGKIIIPLRYEAAWGFSEGKALVKKDKKYGYIDQKGVFLIEPVYEEAGDFSQGLAFVRKNGKYGFIDEKGNEVIPMIFDSVKNFFEKKAAAALYDIEKDRFYWGFIDTSGKWVIPPKFTNADRFSDGIAAVQFGYSWGYIDEKMKIILKPKFLFKDNDFPEKYHNGLLLYQQEGKYGYLNTKGEVEIPANFTKAGIFSENKAFVSEN